MWREKNPPELTSNLLLLCNLLFGFSNEEEKVQENIA